LITIDVNPIVFTIFGISIRWYGVMVALGLTVLVFWIMWQVRRGARISYDRVLTVALVGIPSGILVSRLLHVADRWELYGQNPGLIFGLGGLSGLAVWGGILGAALGVWIYSRFSDFEFGYFVDLAAPGVILAQVLGRIGCTLNGCCFGGETDIFCAIVYTHPESYAPLGIGVHPTTIYEIIYLLIVFGVLLGIRGRLRPDGSLFMIYLSLYSLWRIGIGFIRDGTPFLFGLHQAQVVGIVVLAIIIPIMLMRTRWISKQE
jgi:phosphatidylglycerol:prolipoprotein diacylglycerol transferase